MMSGSVVDGRSVPNLNTTYNQSSDMWYPEPDLQKLSIPQKIASDIADNGVDLAWKLAINMADVSFRCRI